MSDETSETIGILRRNELFGDLSDTELASVADMCSGVQVGRDATLFQENDWATALYLVVEGQVALKKRLPAHGDHSAHDTVITTCQRSDAIGWSALAEPHRYSLTATLRGECSYIAVDGQALDQLMAEDPALSTKVLTALSRIISRRLRDISERLVAERMLVIGEAARRL